MDKIYLKAESNSLWTLAHTARRADDPESMVLILEKLLHNARLQVLNKEQEQQEADWSGKMPDIRPVSGLMTKEDLARALAP